MDSLSPTSDSQGSNLPLKLTKADTLPPCRVCNGPARGIHYGVTTCNACKAFFHRSLRFHTQYSCSADSRCQIQHGVGKMCQACRYEKCLVVGLSKRGIKKGRYTSERKTNFILEAKRADESSSDSTPSNALKTEHMEVESTHFAHTIHQTRLQLDECEHSSIPPSMFPLNSTSDGYPSHATSEQHLTPQYSLPSASCSERSSPSSVSPQWTQDSGLHYPINHTLLHTSQQWIFPESCATNSNTAPLLNRHADFSPISSNSGSISESPEPDFDSFLTSSIHENLSSSSSKLAHNVEAFSDSIPSIELADAVMNGLTNRSSPPLSAKHFSDMDSNPDNSCSAFDTPVPSLEGRAHLEELYSDKEAVLKSLMDAHQVDLRERFKPPEDAKREAHQHYENCKLHREMFGRLGWLPNDEYDLIFQETGLDADGRQNECQMFISCIERGFDRMLQFVKAVPGFTSLPLDEKVKVLKFGRLEFGLLCNYVYANVDLGVIRNNNQQWVCILEMFTDETDEVLKNYSNICRKLQALQLCEEEWVLLKAMSAMAPGRHEATTSQLMDQIYWNLTEMLILHLGKRRTKPLMVFAKIIDILTHFREVETQIIEVFKKLNVYKYCDFDEKPLLKEILIDFYVSASELE